MKKKPHHSTVFRRKATGQINQLQRELRGYEVAHKVLRRQINELEADKRTLSTKLSAMATKLASVEDSRNNLLKSNEEKQRTIGRLDTALREIYQETLGVSMHTELDPALQALNAVKDQMARSEQFRNHLNKAENTIAKLGDSLSEQRSVAESFKREASVHRDRATFLESQLRQRDNTCGKLMAGLVVLGAIIIGVAIYNL